MRSLLQRIENNESVLLMYLAGELPAEDAAEVEQMLATDSGLRHSLEALRSLQDSFTVSMSGLDGMAMPEPVRVVTARRVSRLMVQQAVRQAAQPLVESLPAPGRRLRIGGWIYPVAVAAMVLVAVGWWGRLPSADYRTGKALVHSGDVKLGIPNDLSSLPADPTTANPFPSKGIVESFDLTSDRDGDERMVSVSAGSFDVSSMFELEPDNR